jgi:hypothetical protein
MLIALFSAAEVVWTDAIDNGGAITRGGNSEPFSRFLLFMVRDPGIVVRKNGGDIESTLDR